MKIIKILMALMMLPFLCGCETDLLEEPTVEKHKLTVRAFLPDEPKSRAQVAYGTPMGPDNTDQGEIFLWTYKDYFTLFNITRLEECPDGLELETLDNGKDAVFESAENYKFNIKAGDLLFACFYETKRKFDKDSINYDERKIFTLGVGTEENKPQYIEDNPDDATLSYMQANLKMYALVKAVEDNKVPDLHFQHLSAMMRVTLRNESGKYIYPTKLEFKYPGTESFFNTTMYLSVVEENGLESNTEDDESNWCNYPSALPGYNLRVYGGNYFYNGSEQYTDNIGTTINGKNGTKDIGDSIKTGNFYELYLTTVPRLGNNRKGDKLSIDLIVRHDTDHPYRITIDNFKVPIEAGKRYWFDLTATPAGTLVLTSQFNPDDYKDTPKTPES